jgi:SAM-dependent methyltransferase
MTTASPTLLGDAMGAYAQSDWHSYYDDVVAMIPRGGELLDVGSGRGGLARWLQDNHDCRVTCVDASPLAISACTAKGLRALHRNLDAGDDIEGSYDVVLFSSSLESVLDPCRVLRQIRHNLRPGGRLVIWTPNFGYAGARLAYLRGRSVKCAGHSAEAKRAGLRGYDDVQFFTHATLTIALAEAGYADLRWRFGRSGLRAERPRDWIRAVGFGLVIAASAPQHRTGILSPFLCVSAGRGE